MSLFSLLNRRPGASPFASVGVAPDGVGVARVLRPEGTAPVLDFCEYRDAEDEEDLRSVLRTLTREHALDKGPCATVMEPGTYGLLLVDAPDVPADELRAAMRWRIKDLIDFHIDDAVVDVFDVPDQKRVAAGRMMYVVAAKAPAVRQRIDLLEGAGLRLSAIDVPELALRNLAALLPEDVVGTALVHLGTESGLIMLTHQSTLYLARRFSFGLRTLESASVSYPGAEGQGWPPGVRDMLDAVVVEVQRSLDYYDSHFSQSPIRHLVLAPLPVKVPGMTEYLSKQLGLSARVMDINQLIDTRKPLEPDMQARCTTLIGEALRLEEVAL